LKREQSERPRADDGGRFAGTRSTAFDGASHDRQRLGQQRVVIGDLRGHRPAAALGNTGQLCEGTVHVDPDGRPLEAQVAVALAGSTLRSRGPRKTAAFTVKSYWKQDAGTTLETRLYRHVSKKEEPTSSLDDLFCLISWPFMAITLRANRNITPLCGRRPG